jgi:hypothetical protein
VGSPVLVATSSAPLTGCAQCAAACVSSGTTLTIHGFTGIGSPLATVTILQGGSPTVVEVDGTAAGTTCTVKQRSPGCTVSGDAVTVELDLLYVTSATGDLEVTIAQGTSSARLSTPIILAQDDVCGEICYNALGPPPDIWLNGANTTSASTGSFMTTSVSTGSSMTTSSTGSGTSSGTGAGGAANTSSSGG